MFYILLFLHMLVFPAIIISILYKILHKLDELKKENKETKPTKRPHTTIKTSNYKNSFNTRGYDQFKNEKTGLYEPQKPHQGIELKSKKED